MLRHGMSYSRIYRIYNGMKNRCYNPNIENYKYYGAKGVEVCDEWLNSFDNFYAWAISSGYKDSLTIDRIDSSKGYCPENCRWITKQENGYLAKAGKKSPRKMKTVNYPCLFTETKEGWLIEVPDLEILTEATSMKNAIEMATDAISVTIESLSEAKQKIPLPSSRIDPTKGIFAGEGKTLMFFAPVEIQPR